MVDRRGLAPVRETRLVRGSGPGAPGGGAFIDEGIYDIDRLRWLAGSEVTRVEARMANLVHRDLAVEDWGFATLTFANGVIATVEASWTIAAPRASGPSPKENSVRRFEIVGTRGEIVETNQGTPGRKWLRSGAAGWVHEHPTGELYAPPHHGALDHLIECIEGGVEPVSRIEDARASLWIALAAYDSARTGGAVRLG
ncbi:MAG: Gfo/Idh/MocA family oxidoreductase [Chloroflexi bacterium]|nr:Gfo/Idh/MocA family oxidoreductase [Chloroflexota bacterium]